MAPALVKKWNGLLNPGWRFYFRLVCVVYVPSLPASSLCFLIPGPIYYVVAFICILISAQIEIFQANTSLHLLFGNFEIEQYVT